MCTHQSRTTAPQCRFDRCKRVPFVYSTYQTVGCLILFVRQRKCDVCLIEPLEGGPIRQHRRQLIRVHVAMRQMRRQGNDLVSIHFRSSSRGSLSRKFKSPHQKTLSKFCVTSLLRRVGKFRSKSNEWMIRLMSWTRSFTFCWWVVK